MLHIHFGTGRLGLGLVVPFFQKPGSEVHLLNRAQSKSRETGSTHLDAQRRNELLASNPEKQYVIQPTGAVGGMRETVHYDGFHAYEPDTVGDITQEVLANSAGKEEGVVVTASVLAVENYVAVVEALNALSAMKDEGGPIGDIYLVACENTVDAREVLGDAALCGKVSPATRRHVKCVHALVDRICVEVEEYPGGTPPVNEPTVAVQTEEYGLLRLSLDSETEGLEELLRGSRVEFSRHLDVEKEIKG